jgi:Putative transposase/Transposase zinc-binding domain
VQHALLPLHSPLENTPHKASNGVISITCRNRHCPKCQANARDRWLEARRRDLLPTPYSHVVFTLPHQLAPLALQNKDQIYSLLFRMAAETLLEVTRDPQRLGAEIGFFGVLHTWNQKLLHHPHVHFVVPAGGLAPDHSRWISAQPRFFLPVEVLGRRFRRKFLYALWELYDAGQLGFHGLLARWLPGAPSPRCSGRCFAPGGWSMANALSGAPSRLCVTSVATPIAWRSPITDWSPWKTDRSSFVGATPPTKTRSG